MHQTFNIVNANQAVAKIAYKTNEVFPIYPVTPSSQMAELAEQWSANKQPNIFDTVPTVFEMQSEAGVAGAMHGALQTGSLSSTFTASQGLLLMLPTLFKVAGELTPNVIHVATRSIATHALSIFGDHSDIMAVRSAGYAMLGAASVQEAHDFAVIAQAATLASRIPFIHFFDGFRTSHETAKIHEVSDPTLRKMIDYKWVQKHKNNALNPNQPVIRGTVQGADMFFQGREVVNSFYNACPDIVQNKMDTFAVLTGRQYNLFEYVGVAHAEHIIITMASSTQTVEETINYLNSIGEKYGLIKVRLFRPFSKKHLLDALPKSTVSIAVLDRTKEPGSSGEPLYLDVLQALSEAFQTHEIDLLPRIIGGRYGLSSKEFTPAMVKSIFDHLTTSTPKNNFTIGIKDDLTNLSLSYAEELNLNTETYQAIFYAHASSTPTNNIDCVSTLIGNTTKKYVQSYTEFDYKKSESRQVTHLRFDLKPIKAPYLIYNANFIACTDVYFIKKDNALKKIKKHGTLLVFSPLKPTVFWAQLSAEIQLHIKVKEVNLILVNNQHLSESYPIADYSISALQACFLAIKNEGLEDAILNEIKRLLTSVNTSAITQYTPSLHAEEHYETSSLQEKQFSNNTNIALSEFPVDGTFYPSSSENGPLLLQNKTVLWNPNSCTQCGACSMACPQGALRMKVYQDSYLDHAPNGFNTIPSNEFDLMNFTLQINPTACTTCNNCVDACSDGALVLTETKASTTEHWNYFKTLPEFDRAQIDLTKISQQQLQEPLFKYASAEEGCGETPYIKLLSQLFGDRLLIANATGSSSIFGGAAPLNPWSINKDGRGPAWSNSLFEDNAEFGLGFRLSLDQQEKDAKSMLKKLTPHLDATLVQTICSASQNSEEDINDQRNRISQLKKELKQINTKEAKKLWQTADALVKKSVWCIGGDGWAYDIGFGGLDHIIASGKNVNILILDNEVYANTGGQMSKASPVGAAMKFAHSGKSKQKKDLGLIAMTYEDVYVASVAIGANQEHVVNAFIEAESFEGPSIIIAYCHSSSHGIDMRSPSQYHKAAVASNQWLLFRNDPRKPHPFQLDSTKATLNIKDYLKNEKRFDRLMKSSNTHLINSLQQNINKRFERYHAMSSS